MPTAIRDHIFVSYSRKDMEIFREVWQKLLDRRLEASLYGDPKIRLSEQWPVRLQEMLDRTAVAILILSDHFFSHREGGGDFILEVELPYLLEHYNEREIDLLLLYWTPSPYFAPDDPKMVEPFEYEWPSGQAREFKLNGIQALCRNRRLALAGDQERLDALLELAREAKRHLARRLAREPEGRHRGTAAGRHLLTVELSLGGSGLQRAFKVDGQSLRAGPAPVPRALLDALRPSAAVGLPSETQRAKLGDGLYRLLFGPEAGELFPRIAEDAWGMPPGTQANALVVEVEIRCDGMEDDPWPLGLPWNLTELRGERLAEHCGWSFEVAPPGVGTRIVQPLSQDPPLLFLFDDGADGARTHAGQITRFLDRAYGYGADPPIWNDLDLVAQRAREVPAPEVLYLYATTALDLERLAAALGDAAPLLVLNLIGETLPTPPDELVRNRKLILSLNGSAEADRARAAGHRWLQGFLEEAGRTLWQGAAVRAFETRVRLWSGCAGLDTRISRARGALFRRPLIKLLLDRVTARREVSDEVATALRQDRGVLGLVAAGTAVDRPGLLPRQVWHHYEHVREAASRDAIHRLEIPAGDVPAQDELLYHLAENLGCGRDDWENAMDRLAGETQPGERVIVSLEWQLPEPPPDMPPEQWRRDWLHAWLDLGTGPLAHYRKRGLLVVSTLLVEATGPAEAEAWCRESRDP